MTDVALDPCGRVMDYLRSCYSTAMRFDPTQPSQLRSVRWYFADPRAPVFLGSTPFRSRVTSNMTSDDGSLGEVHGQPRAWSNGKTPLPYPAPGSCAPDSDFATGIALGGAWPVGPNGVKACCGVLPEPLPCGLGPAGFPTVQLSDSLGGNYTMPAILTQAWQLFGMQEPFIIMSIFSCVGGIFTLQLEDIHGTQIMTPNGYDVSLRQAYFLAPAIIGGYPAGTALTVTWP
jgi:hypothetical protein